MIDKGKLLKWIEDINEIYSGPFDKDDTPIQIASWNGKKQIVNKLKMYIEAGEFNHDEKSS